MSILIKSKFSLILTLYLLLLFFMPTDAIAGIFDPPVTDRSVEYLGKLLGSNVGSIHLGVSSDSSSFIGSLFQMFNGVVLAIAVLILSYVGGVSIMHTAHEGEVMGKKWSSIWIPLRSSFGLMLLAPIPGSGYSLIQSTIVWIVLNGIGAADKIWNVVLDNLGQGISVTQNTNIDTGGINALKANGKNIAQGILQSLVCINLVNANADSSVTTYYPFTAYFTPAINVVGSLNFGAEGDTGNPTRQSLCGSIPIRVTPQTIYGATLSGTQQQTLISNAYAIKRLALQSMIGTIQPVAKVITDPGGGIPNTDGLLSTAITGFISNMSGLNKASMVLAAGGSLPQQNIGASIDTLKQSGWILAGSYYTFFGRSSQQGLLDTATRDQPINASCPLINGSSTIDTQKLSNALLKGTANAALFSRYSQTLSAGNISRLFNDISAAPRFGTSFHPAENMRYLYIAVAIVPAIVAPLVALVESTSVVVDALFNIGTGGGDPLLEMATAGVNMMIVAEVFWMALTMGVVIASIPSYLMSCANSAGYTLTTAIFVLIPMLLALVGGIWVIGATHAVYLPMVPYMIFTVTALGWFISVIESVVAAPLVALGLILPSQEELGAIKPALGMIGGVFLRPMLMIIGLIFGAKFFQVVIFMINEGCKAGLQNLIWASGGNSSMFAWAPMLILYTGFVIAAVNKCYSLIHHLPDKVLSWIGIGGEQTDVSMVEKAKGSFDQGVEKAGTESAAVGQTASKGATEQLNKMHSPGGAAGGADASALGDAMGGKAAAPTPGRSGDYSGSGGRSAAAPAAPAAGTGGPPGGGGAPAAGTGGTPAAPPGGGSAAPAAGTGSPPAAPGGGGDPSGL